LAVEDDSGDVLWGLADHQGTIRDVIDSAASLVQHRKYDSFGNADVTPVADFLFAYTGRPLDPDTGLYDYRARWYDADVGRFVSEDPLGFAAGDMNTYRYVGNSPLDYTDPSGMSSFSGVGGATSYESSLLDFVLGGEAEASGTSFFTAELLPPERFHCSTCHAPASATNPISPAMAGLDPSFILQEVSDPGRSQQLLAYAQSQPGPGAFSGPVPSQATAERAGGALEIVGGAGQILLGGVLITGGGTSELGTGGGSSLVSIPAVVVGGALGLRGADHMTTGWDRVWTGEPQQTLVAETVTSLGGSPTAAWVTDTMADVALMGAVPVVQPMPATLPRGTTVVQPARSASVPSGMTAAERATADEFFNNPLRGPEPYVPPFDPYAPRFTPPNDGAILRNPRPGGPIPPFSPN